MVSSSNKEPSPAAGGRLLWAPLLAIGASAFAVEVPFFFLGTPSGHDVEFHLYSWLEILLQWKQGIIYPRWAALAHFAYGEPRFIFYPPASLCLGGALTAIFPWTLTAGIYIWLALTLAGISMFLLARRWLNRRDAAFAAVFYAINPYHLVIVYWRSALAELLASFLLPLLLLLLLTLGKKRATVWLALLLGCAWLINAPAAVMIQYSVALLLIVIAWQKRSPAILVLGAAAVLLGAGLAAFYLLPAAYEQKWVNIAEAVSQGSRPQDNFLFTHTADAEHDAFNRVISWVALCEISLTLAAAWLARKWRNHSPLPWQLLVTWAAASALLMSPISYPVWSILPELHFMQFPWRWLLCLGIPFALFVAAAVRRWASRVLLYLATLAVLAFVWIHFQPPWWDHAADLREMQENMATGAGYEGSDEYTPIAADASLLDKDARRVTVQGAARAAIHVSVWNAERKILTADMSAPDNLVLRLFNYPAWRVEVNDRVVQATTREGTGQMLVPVQAGANRVEITLIRTWDCTAGGWISAIAVILWLLWMRVKTVSRLPSSRVRIG